MRKLLLFAFLLFYFWDVNAQQCGTESSVNSAYQRIAYTPPYVPNNNNLCINVAFRIVRNNDGSNSYDVSKIPAILNNLNQVFNPHNITISQVGTFDFINNTAFNNNTSGSSGVPAIPNAINIYLVTKYSSAGISFFPTLGTNTTTRIIVQKSGLTSISETIAHEIGHCLNLKHTFQCSYYNPSDYSNPPPCYNFDASCAENPGITNDSTHGDLVGDTPADKYITPNSCIPPGWNASLYNPDKTNIMSYWLDFPRDHFTAGQGNRMREAIENASYLQPFRSFACSNIIKPTIFCGSGIFSVSNATFGSPTFSWSVMGNLEIVGSSTNPTVNIKRWSPSDSGGLVSVIINGTITRTISITPKCNAVILGKYDWVSKDYGNMGLIVPINPEEETITSYIWEIKENEKAANNEGNKPYFVGSATNEPLKYTSNSNQAIVNWGSCSGSYFLSCYGVSASGEQFLIDEGYVDVGDPKNNPCFKNAITTTIAPNPIQNSIINVVLNKPSQNSPCNYKDLSEPQYFNSEIDEINNSVSIFDYNGTEVYRKVFEMNEFVIDDANLQSGNNYIVNLYTKEGGFTQQVIIVN